MKTFSEKVLDIVGKIRSGETMTYKEVAVLIGIPKAYRAVGNVLNKNYNALIPCHRVVRSDGTAGGYNRGRQKKIRKLKSENIFIK